MRNVANINVFNAYLSGLKRGRKHNAHDRAVMCASRVVYIEQQRIQALKAPNYARHEEPPFNEEIAAIQEKMLVRFGRKTGAKVKHAPANYDLSKYGMEVCHACGQLTAVEFPCAHCDAERPVIIEDKRKVA